MLSAKEMEDDGRGKGMEFLEPALLNFRKLISGGKSLFLGRCAALGKRIWLPRASPALRANAFQRSVGGRIGALSSF